MICACGHEKAAHPNGGCLWYTSEWNPNLGEVVIPCECQGYHAINPDDCKARFVGMMRVKNEARWIEDVVIAALKICDRVFIMDDHSEDRTADLCRDLARTTVLDSPFHGLDESRDKNWLYDRILDAVPVWSEGHTWILCIDGDELLDAGAADHIKTTLLADQGKHEAFSLRIYYLWNNVATARVDRVYGNFHRPSLFRIFNPGFRFQTTPWGGNLHCSSIPQELIHNHGKSEAILWHLGYMLKEDRLRKHSWYNQVDPANAGEDFYRHVVQGDIPEVPASAVLRHAGPLRLVPVDSLRG